MRNSLIAAATGAALAGVSPAAAANSPYLEAVAGAGACGGSISCSFTQTDIPPNPTGNSLAQANESRTLLDGSYADAHAKVTFGQMHLYADAYRASGSDAQSAAQGYVEDEFAASSLTPGLQTVTFAITGSLSPVGSVFANYADAYFNWQIYDDVTNTNVIGGVWYSSEGGPNATLVKTFNLPAGHGYYIHEFADIGAYSSYGVVDVSDYTNTLSTYITTAGGAAVTGASGHTYSVPFAGGVPEPASWALLLVGFGAVGLARRRSVRKRTPRAVCATQSAGSQEAQLEDDTYPVLPARRIPAYMEDISTPVRVRAKSSSKRAGRHAGNPGRQSGHFHTVFTSRFASRTATLLQGLRRDGLRRRQPSFWRTRIMPKSTVLASSLALAASATILAAASARAEITQFIVYHEQAYRQDAAGLSTPVPGVVAEIITSGNTDFDGGSVTSADGSVVAAINESSPGYPFGQFDAYFGPQPFGTFTANLNNSGTLATGSASFSYTSDHYPGVAPQVSNYAALQAFDPTKDNSIVLTNGFMAPGEASSSSTIFYIYDEGNFNRLLQYSLTPGSTVFDVPANTAAPGEKIGYFFANEIQYATTVGGVVDTNIYDKITTGEINAVPEPSTWAMMLVGFAGVAAASRGRRRRSVDARAG